MEQEMMYNNGSGRKTESAMDVYSIIRSAEIRDYFRKEDCMDFFGKERLILHSYTSVQQKMDMLRQLSKSGDEEDGRCVDEMYRVYKEYTDLIYHPIVRTIFLLKYEQPCWEDGRTKVDEDVLGVYDTLDEVTEKLESLAKWADRSYYGEVDVIQIPQDEKVKTPCKFTLFWIDGKWQIKDFKIEDEELKTRGIGEDTRFWFNTIGNYHPLPFQNGDRLKVKMPFMEEPFYGIIWSELDGNGCWYHWLNYDWEEGVCVNITNMEFDICSGYSTLDWVERVVF